MLSLWTLLFPILIQLSLNYAKRAQIAMSEVVKNDKKLQEIAILAVVKQEFLEIATSSIIPVCFVSRNVILFYGTTK